MKDKKLEERVRMLEALVDVLFLDVSSITKLLRTAGDTILMLTQIVDGLEKRTNVKNAERMYGPN